jgi:hypothetical protein
MASPQCCALVPERCTLVAGKGSKSQTTAEKRCPRDVVLDFHPLVEVHLFMEGTTPWREFSHWKRRVEQRCSWIRSSEGISCVFEHGSGAKTEFA